MEYIQFSYQGNETWSTARPNSLAAFVFTIYRWTAVSMSNAFQDQLQLRKTADNTECYT